MNYTNMKVAGVRIQTGCTDKQLFSSACQEGNWRTWNIVFYHPFSEVPAVFLSPNGPTPNVAVVGIAQNVTTEGFDLCARNSDCTSGEAGFCWLAIGPA